MEIKQRNNKIIISVFKVHHEKKKDFLHCDVTRCNMTRCKDFMMRHDTSQVSSIDGKSMKRAVRKVLRIKTRGDDVTMS